jgi:hypothetical protein
MFDQRFCNGELIPRLYNVATTNNLLCDTVQIQWRNANLPLRSYIDAMLWISMEIFRYQFQ